MRPTEQLALRIRVLATPSLSPITRGTRQRAGGGGAWELDRSPRRARLHECRALFASSLWSAALQSPPKPFRLEVSRRAEAVEGDGPTVHSRRGPFSTQSFSGAESGMKPPMFRPSFLGLVYIVVGVAVAASYDYFKNLETFRRIASAVLAVLLWPLLLLGIDLHIQK